MDFTWYIVLHDYLKNHSYPNASTKEIRQRIRNNSRRYYAKGQRLFLKSNSSTPVEVLHSANLRETILKIHEEGHFGTKNTYIRTKLQFYAEHLYEACQDTVNSCDVCQKRARPAFRRTVPAQLTRQPTQPFEIVGVDAVGPLPVTKEGNRYLLVAIDLLTRWPIAAAVPDITVESTIDFLMNHLFATTEYRRES